MRRYWALILVGMLLMAAVAGCGSKEPANDVPAGTQTQTQTETGSQTGSQSSSDLSSIMKSASQIKGMSFDMVSTMTGQDGTTVVSSGKMFVQDEQARVEMEAMGMKMITLVKGDDEIYLYNPDTNSAMKMSGLQEGTEPPNAWADESGDASDYTVVGEEKMDGHDCLVVTLTEDSNTKMWVRKDIGMPVRMEAKSDDGNMVVEYKNYDLSAQPASLFELPAGTQITSMPNLPNVPQ